MAGAAGGVTDGQVQECGDLLFCAAARACRVKQGIQGGIEQALDQGGGCVVGTRLLPFVAGENFKGVGPLVGVVVRDQFKQRLVDAAEFFGAQVAEVHPAQRAAVAGLDQGQRADRGQQRLVG